MSTLQFSAWMAAPRALVWDTMLAQASYRDWTSAFAPKSCYEGSWEQGQAIRFLDGEGRGMHAVITLNRLHEALEVGHLGGIEGGVDQPIEAGSSGFGMERYTFLDEAGGTRLVVDTEVPQAYADFMQKAWAQALARLVVLCEQAAAQPGAQT
jgi:hypothetical protein